MKSLKKYFSIKAEIDFSFVYQNFNSDEQDYKIKRICLNFYAKLNKVAISNFKHTEYISENKEIIIYNICNMEQNKY